MSETIQPITDGAGLKAARKALGLTQKQLGAIIGRSYVTLSRMEGGALIDRLTALAVECLQWRAQPR